MKPKTFLQRVLDFALSEIDKRARPEELPVSDRSHEESEQHATELSNTRESGLAAPASAREAKRRSPPSHEVSGLEAVRAAHGERLTLRWSIGEDDVARAESLVSGKGVLCLRVVSFSPARDDVVREVRDRPGVELAGECELSDAPQRAVVALGVRTGERFVSIAHHLV